MQVKMIYHTPNYHKLVEALARNCYQSYERCTETSHNMLKGIMAKGHLSVASVGNIVFKLQADNYAELVSLYGDLIAFKEITPFIRWTFPNKQNQVDRIVVSMNVLTLMDINNNYVSFHDDNDHPSALLPQIIEQIKAVPYLHWFLDHTVDVPSAPNEYLVTPDWSNPIVLTQDYTALKELGFTDYELDTHATVTVDLVTDRATGLQMWRHVAYQGGTELSQRYVDRSNASFRVPVGLEQLNTETEDWVEWFKDLMNSHLSNYNIVKEELENAGIGKMRAKEMARNLLPNIQTRIIQCRPLKYWKHYINLRNTPHAQAEIREDTKALISSFQNAGIEI